MCKIGITINVTNGVTLGSANGRYRKVGDPTWINFPINLGTPETPDITEVGDYELEVQVISDLGEPSAWKPSTFEISSNCNPAQCTTWYIQTNSNAATGENTSVTFTYCNGSQVTLTPSIGQTITVCGTLDSIDQLAGWSGPITPDNIGTYGRVWNLGEDCAT